MSETTEKIVETYVRFIMGWATIANIRCGGQQEIDLFAVDPRTSAHYHIETSVSISTGFRRLTNKLYDPEKAKIRLHAAAQRRTLGFFIEKKFGAPAISETLARYGVKNGECKRIIVTWGWDDGVEEEAAKHGVELWDFRGMMAEIADTIGDSRQYFDDDTLRTLGLYVHALKEIERREAKQTSQAKSKSPSTSKEERGFCVYENRIRRRARIHKLTCPYARGRQGKIDRATSSGVDEWYGPFETLAEATTVAKDTHQRDISRCGHCLRSSG